MLKITYISPYFHTISLCVLTLLAAPGCKPETSGAETAAATGAPSGSPTPKPNQPPAKAATSADQAEGAKLHAAIECINGLSNRVAEARREYLKDVDPATGNSKGKQVHLLGLTSILPCARGVKEAGEIKPAIPALDTASAKFVTTIEALEKGWQDLGGYYQKGDYLDDKGKKAAELHPKVMDALKAFGAANEELATTVRTMNRARRVAKLAAREKAEGRKLAVIMDAMMLEAETLIDQAMAKETTAEILDPQIAIVSKLIDELDTYADTHKDEASKFGSLGNIKNYEKTFLAATKVVARKLRAKGTPTGSEFNEITDQYNYLVQNYNH